MSTPRFRSYVICTSPRSGSTLLCGLLERSGVAGRPDSHFHEPSLSVWLSDYGLTGRFTSRADSLCAVFAAARQRGDGGTGVFGLRIQYQSLAFFLSQARRLFPEADGDAQAIEAAFGAPMFIHLSRSDKVEQAVSRVMAEQTGLWHRASDGSELERLAPPAEPRYDRAAIALHLAELSKVDAQWEDWFVREGVIPLRLLYENLAAAPQATLARVLAALGLDPGIAHCISIPTSRLADATSRDWVARFRAEHGT